MDTLNEVKLNGYTVSVKRLSGWKQPYKGSSTTYEIHTDGKVDASQLRKLWADHEGIPLSEDADWHGKRVTTCQPTSQPAVFQLTVHEPYTD